MLDGQGQSPVQTLELVVHRDPQGLKNPRRRMHLEIGAARYPAHAGSQLGSRGERTAAHDLPGHPSGVGLLAVSGKDPGQFVLGRRVHQIRGRGARRWVHSHVERPRMREREAPFRRVELHAGNPEIEKDHVELRQAVPRQGAVESFLQQDESSPLGFQAPTRKGEGFWVAIYTVENSVRSDGLKKGTTVASEAQRTVKNPIPRLRDEQPKGGFEHDRNVPDLTSYARNRLTHRL